MAAPLVVKREPVVTIGAIVSAIVAVALVFGFNVDATTLTIILTSIAPLVGALIGRNFVTPSV